jgi:hypothetical protein
MGHRTGAAPAPPSDTWGPFSRGGHGPGPIPRLTEAFNLVGVIEPRESPPDIEPDAGWGPVPRPERPTCQGEGSVRLEIQIGGGRRVRHDGEPRRPIPDV